MICLNRISRAASLLFLTIGLTACGGGGGGGGVSIGEPDGGNSAFVDTGTVTLLATDAETDQFKEINLTVIRAELLSADGSGAVELFEGEKTFDLLALTDVTEVFSVSEVPEGAYEKLRLILSQIELVFHDGRPPYYPSLPGNGKLDLNPRGVFLVDADNPLTVEMDFDAEKSIKVTGAGDRFNFRPVVFTKQVENQFDTKLIRQTGEVRGLDLVAGTFNLCLVDDSPEDPDCIYVDAARRPATIFNSTAEPTSLDSLSNGAIVTVVGRLQQASDSLEFRNALEEELEDDASEDDASEDDASEDDASEDDASEDDASEDDASEDDASEDDASEDDASEDDASEDDASEDDGEEGSDSDRVVLVAALIWLGEDITRTENIACGEVDDSAGAGPAYDNAELPLADGETCDSESRATLISEDTLIYDREGNELPLRAIRAGLINVVDGFMLPEQEGGALRAVLVIFDLEEEEDERVELPGAIGEVETESLILITDIGDRCVLFEEDETDVFEMLEGGGGLEFTQRDVSSLVSGLEASVFGQVDQEGCVEADNIIYQSPVE